MNKLPQIFVKAVLFMTAFNRWPVRIQLVLFTLLQIELYVIYSV